MKKIVSLVLAALLVLSLAACGDKNNASDGNPVRPTSALNILETVWNTYGEDEKFAVVGGDFSEANTREDAGVAVALGTGTFVKGYKAVFDRLGADWLYR